MEDRVLKRSDFTHVALEEFISGSELVVDLYIQLSDQKFIQIAKAGERVQLERFLNYKNKKVTHLCIRNNDYVRYVNRGLTIAGIVLSKEELPLAQRQTTLFKAAASVFTEIEKQAINKEIYYHSRSVISATISLCQGKTQLFQLMHHFATVNPSLYAHSVAVSTVAVMIGMGLNWKQSVTIEKLGLGGLLHDIGKRELTAELFVKPRAQMSKEELLDYESHCQRGALILRSLPDIPDDVISIAYEHHENGAGFGYPRRLKQMYINPLARVVGLANEFCNLTMPNANQPKPRSPMQAITHIEAVMGQPYAGDAFQVLKELMIKGEEKKTA